jgi:hypothetical protein
MEGESKACQNGLDGATYHREEANENEEHYVD